MPLRGSFIAFLLAIRLAAPAGAADRKIDPVQAEAAAAAGLFYDLQLDRALKAADDIEQRHPRHPAGPFYKGIHYYLRLLVSESISTGTVNAFESQMLRCVSAAENGQDLAPATAEYYMGAAYGFKARVSVMRRNWFDALREARLAVSHVQKAADLDPSMDDLYLGLGMYHYYMARLPVGLKPFAYLLIGLWGDREKGLAELERAAQRAAAAGPEAMEVLAYVYGSDAEGQWEKADAFLKKLIERYPGNPCYRIWRAHSAARRGRWKESVEILDVDGKWQSGVSPEIRPLSSAYARYLAAESLLLAGDAAGAERQLDALESSAPPYFLRGRILLRRANLVDLQGKREQALALYRQAEGRAAERAAAFIETPFSSGTDTPLPLDWPRFAMPD